MSTTRTSLFAKLFRRAPKTIRSPKPNRTRLGLTTLEAREVPAAYLSGGSLVIDGTSGPDTVTVTETTGFIACVQVVQNGSTQTFLRSSITTGQLYFRGYAGNDVFQMGCYLAAYADGGTGSDVLSGSPLGDTLIGGASDEHDAIYGNGGNDVLSGGGGPDEIRGGDGNDYVYGDAGNDTLRGGPGNDMVYGGDNDDYLYGDNNAGDAGGVGNDTLYGNAGNDVLTGESGNDKLYGGADNDILIGNEGNDWLDAGSAAEYASGGGGTDFNAYVTTVNGARYTDITQASSETCWIYASIGSLVHSGIDLSQRITYIGNDTYNVQVFHRRDINDASKGYVPVIEQVRFDGSAVATDPGRDPAQEGESWLIILHRAAVQAIGHFDPSQTLAGTHSGGADDAFGVLTGTQSTKMAPSNFTGAEQLTDLIPYSGKHLVAHTKATAGTLVGGHAYTVLGRIGDQVLLYNPWGSYQTVSWTTFSNDVSWVCIN
jgi:hypothetical protein